MRFQPASLMLPLPVFMAVAVVLSADAQPASQPAPKNDGGTTPTAPSLAPDKTQRPSYPDNVETPPSFIFNPGDNQPLPQMPVPSPEEQRLLQKQEESKNWALMTPREIFGIKTPAEIFGIQQRDAAGRVVQPTQLERYMARQDEALAMAATNGWQFNVMMETQDFFGNQQQAGRLDTDNQQDNSQQSFDGFLNSTPNTSSASSDQGANADSLWQFGKPLTPKADSQSQADLGNFSQLLGASSFSAATPSSAAAGTFLPAPATKLNSILDQPAMNPAGASFTPLTNGLVGPQGLTPLTGLNGGNQNNSQPTPPPSWAPQPAPWLSQGPQSFTPPQRKF